MKGIEVKNILKKNGFVISKVAGQMGETPQNLNSLLNADDIKTGVLERVAKAINKSLYFFFESAEGNISEKNINDRLLDIIESQQRTIEILAKKTAVQAAEDAECVGAAQSN